MPNCWHRRLMLRSGCRARVKNSCRSRDTVVSPQGMVRIPSVGTGEVLPMSSYGCYLCVRSVHLGRRGGSTAAAGLAVSGCFETLQVKQNGRLADCRTAVLAGIAVFQAAFSGRTSRRNAYFPVALLASCFNAPAWNVIPVGNFSTFPFSIFSIWKTIKSGALASSKRVISIFF